MSLIAAAAAAATMGTARFERIATWLVTLPEEMGDVLIIKLLNHSWPELLPVSLHRVSS